MGAELHAARDEIVAMRAQVRSRHIHREISARSRADHWKIPARSGIYGAHLGYISQVEAHRVSRAIAAVLPDGEFTAESAENIAEAADPKEAARDRVEITRAIGRCPSFGTRASNDLSLVLLLNRRRSARRSPRRSEATARAVRSFHSSSSTAPRCRRGACCYSSYVAR